MSSVTIEGSGYLVDASLISDAFGIEPSSVLDLMRRSDITSRCETGVAEDEGRSRLTFYYEGKAVRLIVDAHGAILGRTILPARRQSDTPARFERSVRA